MLAHILTTLNKRHSYGLDLFLLSIDEGITGDHALPCLTRQRLTSPTGYPAQKAPETKECKALLMQPCAMMTPIARSHQGCSPGQSLDASLHHTKA